MKGSGTSVRGLVHVVEDDSSVRTSLVRVLEAAGFATREYDSAAEFLIAERGTEPGCILLDIGLPGLSGMDLHDALRKSGDSTPVVFLTGRGDIETSVRAMKAGAVDFLTKPAHRAALIPALESALAREARTRSHNDEVRVKRERFSHLTPRERQVFLRVAQGRLNKQVAHELGTSVRTVKAHRAQVMTKLGLSSVAELVRFAEVVGAPDDVE
jgi:FixJ family two-component response regulator